MSKTAPIILASCAILFSACCEQPQPVVSSNPIPTELLSSFENSNVVQKLRIIELTAECEPRDVEELHKITPSAFSSPHEYYEALSKKITSAKFTTLVEAKLPQGGARPKGKLNQDNDTAKFNADVSAKSDDLWEIRFALEAKKGSRPGEEPSSVKTTCLMKSGTLKSLGGMTKTPPGGSGKAMMLQAFIEISPSAALLPASASKSSSISR